jgi:hypothetical protein
VVIWKHYIPTGTSVFLALVFLRWQGLAVAVIVLGCLAYGIFHAVCVSQLIQEELTAKRQRPSVSPSKGPSLRDVARLMAKKTKLLKNS